MKQFSLAAVVLIGTAYSDALHAQATSPSDVKVVAPTPEPAKASTAQAFEELLGAHGPLLHGPLREDGSRLVFSRQSAEGKRVIVEGIAWGQRFGHKRQEIISPRAGVQIIHEGDSISVRGIDFTEANDRGKPVRVTGILKLDPGARSVSHPTIGWSPYYYIDATKYDLLDAVTEPYVVLAPE